MESFYKINVKWVSGLFTLYNYDIICGDRLYKGEDPKDSKQRWPFKEGTDWVRYEEKVKADKAAARLQAYLDAREGNKPKKEK